MTQPVVPSAVSYEDVQEGNDLYEPSDNVPHSQPTGIGTREATMYLSALRRRWG